MRKKINFILKNMIGFTLGVSLSIILAVYAATQISSSQVTYTGNSQSTVNGALDDLYTKANTWINPNIELNKITTTNSAGTVYATSSGICIVRKGKLSCFKTNNWAEEKTHIQQVFSDIICNVASSYVSCSASDFDCNVGSSGSVYCSDLSDDSICGVKSAGSVDCD